MYELTTYGKKNPTCLLIEGKWEVLTESSTDKVKKYARDIGLSKWVAINTEKEEAEKKLEASIEKIENARKKELGKPDLTEEAIEKINIKYDKKLSDLKK